jgi:hypothetical protein
VGFLPLKHISTHLSIQKPLDIGFSICAAIATPKSFGLSKLCGLNFPFWNHLPSGKHTKIYGKSPVSIGKSAINGNFQ